MEDPKKKKNRLHEEAAQEEDAGLGKKSWDSYFEQLRASRAWRMGRGTATTAQAEANWKGDPIPLDGRAGGQTNGSWIWV